MKPSPGQAGGGRPQRLLPPVALVLGILATTVGGVPTSVLASAKDSGNAANHDDGGGGGGSSDAAAIRQQSVTADPLDARNHQISVPQKRGVNPLLYNDLDYSGNSIPHGGQWDDEGLFEQGPLSAAALYPTLGGSGGHSSDGGASGRLRNYDLLASLLGPPPPPPSPVQTFYDGPVTPSVSFPYGYGYGLDRNKRMANFGHGKNQHQRSLSSRLKRSPGKLTTADALSLLAILDSRDPYSAGGGPLSEYGPNDVLPYSPSSSMAMANQATQDIPLSLALAQLLAERNNLGGGGVGRPLLSPYGGDLRNGNDDDDGQWMNSWTEPGVDYLGFPMDVGAARINGNGYGFGKPSKIGFTPQKRFMVSKRKRSVGSQQDDDDSHHEEEGEELDADCKSDKKTCLLRKYGQLAGGSPAKVVASA